MDWGAWSSVKIKTILGRSWAEAHRVYANRKQAMSVNVRVCNGRRCMLKILLNSVGIIIAQRTWSRQTMPSLELHGGGLVGLNQITAGLPGGKYGAGDDKWGARFLSQNNSLVDCFLKIVYRSVRGRVCAMDC